MVVNRPHSQRQTKCFFSEAYSRHRHFDESFCVEVLRENLVENLEDLVIQVMTASGRGKRGVGGVKALGDYNKW